MKLIVIGNGFDRHHDLPTEYNDYRGHLFDKSILSLNECWRANCIFPTLTENKKIDAGRAVFREVLWSDLESALSKWMRNPLLLKDVVPYEPFHILTKIFSNENLRQWALSVNELLEAMKPKTYFQKLFSGDTYFICFNYTDTLIQLYGIPENRILFIHGRASNVDDQLILVHCSNVGEELHKARYQVMMVEVVSNNPEVLGSYSDLGCVDDVLNSNEGKLLQTLFYDLYKNPIENFESKCSFISKLNLIDQLVVSGHGFQDGYGLTEELRGGVLHARWGLADDPIDFIYYQYLCHKMSSVSMISYFDHEMSDMGRLKVKAMLGRIFSNAKIQFPTYKCLINENAAYLLP